MCFMYNKLAEGSPAAPPAPPPPFPASFVRKELGKPVFLLFLEVGSAKMQLQKPLILGVSQASVVCPLWAA